MTSSTKALRQTRFLIVGLPRSGTTYLMTLLNAHRDVLCGGEQFNPFAIIGAKDQNRDFPALRARDQRPQAFSKAFFDAHADGPHRCVGYKFMLGHNIRMLKALPELSHLSLIYVHRRNKLAQASSLIKADTTKRWAQSERDEHVDRKINVGPLKISQHAHEFATWDFLFSDWFESLPNKKIALEYGELFRAGFEHRLCEFLDVDPDPDMSSPLVKQGQNTILDRFEKPEPIRRYFVAIGRESWLGPEI